MVCDRILKLDWDLAETQNLGMFVLLWGASIYALGQ